MKVIVSESLGAGYTSNIISSCNDAGVQAIADYNGNEILFYDPANRLFARHSDIIKNMDIEIFDMFRDRKEKEDDGKVGLELRKEVMKPTEGDDFEKFATEWDALQREESPDIIKTKNCSMIRVSANESGMSRSSMKGEYTVKIQWTRDFPEFGIIAGDSDEVKVQFSEIDALSHAHGGNGLDELIEEKMNEEYPGMGQIDCDVDYIIANETEMYDYHDMFIGKERVYERFAANKSTLSDGGMDDNVSEWYAERFPDDDLAGRINTQVTFQDAMDCIDYGADIYDLLGTFDSTIRERLFAELAARTGIEYGKLYRKWLKNSAFDESFDSAVVYWKPLPDDQWPPSTFGGVHDIEGVLNEVKFMAQQCPEGDVPEIDHIMIGNKEYDERDIDKVRREMEKEEIEMYRENYEDDPRDWSSNEDEVEIQWMIDDKELGIYSGEKETVVIDLDLVDCFEELVYQVTNALEKEYGMPFDYDDEWILVDEVELIKRFGCSMSESGSSNGGTIDVTIKFTHGHYGKKLKSGDEKTIKLDTSTAPTIYDQDDMLTWIADVASDQIPGLGKVTKYDFETIDPPDDVLIRAVMGDEGFGPDVDVDFEDFDPEDVPSEISYKDALKFYRKMHDAYDERKLDYTKYDKIRNKLMDAIVKGLLKEKSLDELADEWFINYGTMNGWGWKTSFKYNVACALHKLHKAKHPDEHVVDREDTIRGWHSEKCSCGLASSSDSSD